MVSKLLTQIQMVAQVSIHIIIMLHIYDFNIPKVIQ